MSDSSPERDPLELLAAEYMERLRRGECPTVEDYAKQHPDLAAEILELFPTIAMTERLKARRERSSGGRATLGAARLERLGDFRIIREIGRGGMGVVFEAEQESLGRRVALKVLPRQALLDEKHLKRFKREARIAANLHHTNIVEVFGVGEQDGFHYFVMQLIEGVGLDAIIPSLARAVAPPPENEAHTPAIPTSPTENPSVAAAVLQLLGQEGQQTRVLGPAYWRSVAGIGLQAAEALNHAHSQQVLHRDIKPANLLLGRHGTLWLADFGLAKAAQSGELSLSRDIVGTLRYMPPEQFRGQTDHRSDLYSLGLSLYELLALRPAYEEPDQSRLIQRITQGPSPALPSTLRSGVPRDLETIIVKAASPEASQRYQSAEALADDLRSFLEDRPIQARRVSSLERLAGWCRRNKGVAALSGTTLFLLVTVAGVASIGYVRTKKALDGEALERAKAEANAGLAIDVLDRMFERFTPTSLRIQPQLALPGSASILEAPSTPILSKEAAALLEGMLPFYDQLARQTQNEDALRIRTAEANRRVGAIRRQLGQFEESAQAYHRALALYSDLRSRAPDRAALKLGAAQVLNELGRLYTSQRKPEDAWNRHLEALALLEPGAAATPASARLRFELARTCYWLGTEERPLPAADPREEKRHGPITAEQRAYLAQAVARLKELTTAAPANPEYQHLLALCYLEKGPSQEGRDAEPESGAERAIVILEHLVQTFPNIPDYAFDLSEALGRIRIPRPPIPPELEHWIRDRLGKSLALLQGLSAGHPGIPDFLAAEARVYDKLGAFHRQMDQWPEAEQNFRQAIAIQSPLAQQFPDAPFYSLWLATFRISFADALLRRERPDEARVKLEQALSALTHQSKQRPDLSPPHDLLALAYSRLAIALRQTGQRDQADAAEQKADQERNAARRLPEGSAR